MTTYGHLDRKVSLQDATELLTDHLVKLRPLIRFKDAPHGVELKNLFRMYLVSPGPAPVGLRHGAAQLFDQAHEEKEVPLQYVVFCLFIPDGI